MKLQRLLILISIMLFAFSTQGFAYFDRGNLIQCVYNLETGVEVATDLGTIGTTIVKDYDGTSDVVLASSGNITQALLGDGSWEDMSLGFVSYYNNIPPEGVSARTYYFATTSETAPGINSAQRSNFQSAHGSISSYYQSLGTTPTVVGSTSHASSWTIKENSGNTSPGAYANLNGDAVNGETTLSALATIGYVDMYLYEYSNSGVLNTGSDTSTSYIAILRLMADGSTILKSMESPVVPIPASLLLFGTGLLGFFGLRRKETCA